MYLTPTQTIITIIAIALGAMLTRFLPFLLFPEGKEIPKIIIYLGKALPPAMMGLLVVYCLKGVNPTSFPFGIPEAIAILAVIALHKWKGNVVLSIGVSTLVYMVLVQSVFI